MFVYNNCNQIIIYFLFSDEKQLLILIPKGQKKKAKQLLMEFEKRPNELTWSSDGIIYVDQVAIPGSNMFTFFPILFKKSKPKLQGFEDFIQKIRQMQLNFIFESESKSESKVSKTSASNEPNSDERWWFLGP